MDAGKLVDDATVLGMIRERLAQPDAAKGFILDGFPRNIAQAEALQQMLAELKTAARGGGAVECRSEGFCSSASRAGGSARAAGGYSTYTRRRRARWHCDKCGGKARLIQRPDDREEVIGKRLEVFEAQTKPLIKHYQDAGLLRVVDADAGVDTVFKSIQRAVGGRARAGLSR